MASADTERRRRPRQPRSQPDSLQITSRDRLGHARSIGARVVGAGDGGLGVTTILPLEAGSLVSVEGTLTSDGRPVQIRGRARVIYCLSLQTGGHRLGLSFEQAAANAAGGAEEPASTESLDCYEVLQLSPNADLDTIHRVYRLLAQRLHPDNADTGDGNAFKRLVTAYRVLSDPEQRAAYDVRHRSRTRRYWRIFDQSTAGDGPDAEKRKRHGILSLLYTKRVREPNQPHLTIMEIEELLACPRDHLECSLWYLKENAWIQRGDNGRYVITATGFDQAEALGVSVLRPDRLLTTGELFAPLAAAAAE